MSSPFPPQCKQKARGRDPPAWTRITAVHTSAGKHRKVASPVNVDLDSSSPVTWRTANVSHVSLKHRDPHGKRHSREMIYRPLMKRWSELENLQWWIIALTPQMPPRQICNWLLTFTFCYPATKDLLSVPLKEGKKHVYQIKSDHLHNQGEYGGYSKGTALMDSAHFL